MTAAVGSTLAKRDGARDAVRSPPASEIQWIGGAGGWPMVSVGATCALLVLGQAAAGDLARHGGRGSSLIFWISVVVAFVVTALVSVFGRLTRAELVAAVVLLGISLQLARIFMYPNMFVYHDELSHTQILNEILRSHSLFAENSILPVGPRYPGLEIATAAVVNLTGLSPHTSGAMVLIIARSIMTLALFLIVERVAKSPRVGAVASLIYMANPQYFYFNSQFSYQTIALPLCFAFVYLILRVEGAGRLRAWFVLASCAVAIAASHHLTPLGLLVMLPVWLVVSSFTKRRPRYLTPALCLLALAVALWALGAQHTLFTYISGIGQNNETAATQLLGGSTGHTFFKDAAGDATPSWEIVTSALSVLLVAALTISGVWWRLRQGEWKRTAFIVASLMALCYPIMPLGHLAGGIAETADRTSGFTFVGVSYVVASWLCAVVPAGGLRFAAELPRRFLLAGACSAVLVVGGIAWGSGPPWLLMPGRFLVDADNRAVDPVALATASWLGSNVEPNRRLYSDRVNEMLALAIGDQHSMSSLADGFPNSVVSRLLLAPSQPADVTIARKFSVQLLLVDRRLATQLPHLSSYTEDIGEFGSKHRKSPPPLSALTKFRTVAGADEIYNNGPDTLYDLRGVR